MLKRTRSIASTVLLAALLAGCAVASGRETAGEYVDDATITGRVNTAIVSEFGPNRIGVETMQNVVQLSGFVEEEATRTKAGTIARGVTGVKDVRNNIIVQ